MKLWHSGTSLTIIVRQNLATVPNLWPSIKILPLVKKEKTSISWKCYFLRSETFVRKEIWRVITNATTSCKSTWDTVPYKWHKWPVHDLVLLIPPPPLIKVASNTRPYTKLGWTTLNGREVSIISRRPVTRSDLKQERPFLRGSVSTFLQLVVANNPDW